MGECSSCLDTGVCVVCRDAGSPEPGLRCVECYGTGGCTYCDAGRFYSHHGDPRGGDGS